METSLSEPAHKRATPPPGPFGYALLSPQDTPYDSAPGPPPGPALLDDNESNMLDNFFTSLNASHFDDNSDFWLSLNDQNNGQPGLGFDFPDLPPTFEGSTTSLPPRSSLPHNKFNGEGVVNDRTGPLSSDVLAAASMLYQNGMNGNDFVSTFNNQIFTDNGLLDANGHSAEAKRTVSRYSAGTDPTGQRIGSSHKDLAYGDKGVHTNKMVFDHEAQNMQNGSGGGKVGTLQWGSDARFADQGYHVPPDQGPREGITTSLLDCLETQPSATNTRPSSPVRGFPNSHNPESNSFGNANTINPTLPYNNTPQTGDPDRPKKRRKSSNKIKEEDPDFETALGYSSNDRNMKERSIYDTTPRKTKANSIAASKQPRENLSEAQKRTNHILSEQKRRNLIKQGFDELCSMVPELKGGGYSKSTMLTQTADWLEELLQGNELLKAQLAEMKARTGG